MSTRTLHLALTAAMCIAAVLLAGCMSPAANKVPTTVPTTPAMTPTPVHEQKGTFTQADSGGTFLLSTRDVIKLRLSENPTTGYHWNLSVTPGLTIQNDSYIPNDTTGKLVGSGGTHVWFLQATEQGTQVITGVYQRSWEAVAGTTPSFTLTLVASGEACGANVCSLPTVTSAVPQGNQICTEADNGKTVQETLMETFGIRLQDNPTTGYSWNLSLTKGLSVTGDEYLPSSTSGQLVGSGGVRSFTILTTARGGQHVVAEYRRPWAQAGTITYQNLEGGFYGILGDDGKKYDPLNLDAKFRENGLRVAFNATVAEGTATTSMWGTPVNLDLIEEIPEFSLNVTVS